MRKEDIQTHEYSFTALFDPAEEGGYTVTVPALPGLVTEGDTLEQARAMAREAIQCHLESMRKNGLSIPTDVELDEPVKEKLTVALDPASAPRLPALTPRKVIAALKRAGFFVDRIKGSHRSLKHPDKPRLTVTVPYHNKDLKRGTLHSIIRQADMTVDEFLKLL